jgi:hypothetical protein
VDRVLRVLVVLDLIAAGAFAVAIVRGPRLDPDPSLRVYYNLWLPLLIETSYMLAFIAGVLALTGAVWRRQVSWAFLLALALAASTYGVIIAFYFDVPYRLLPSLLNLFAGNALLTDAIVPAILSLLALVYSFWPRRHGLAPGIEVTRLGTRTSAESNTDIVS